MAVRSARLARGSIAPGAGAQVAYTCPAGRTAIVKDIRAYNGNPGAVSAAISVRSGPSTVGVFVGPLASAEAVQRQGFIVLEPGDEIVVQSVTAAYTYWISGAELDGVAP